MPQPPKTTRIGEEVAVNDLVPIGAEVDPSLLADETATTPTAVEGGAVGRFLGGVGEMVNPITIAKGIGQAVLHPLDTGAALVQAQVDQLGQAKDAAGRMLNAPSLGSAAMNASEALGHGVAGVLPVLGPMAAAAGERIGSGDVAGGLGNAVGILAPMGIKPAAGAVRKALPGGKLATALERSARDRMVGVTAPTVGANKIRFGAMAEDVAPRLAKEPGMGAWSVDTLHAKAGERLAKAEQLLDDAAEARLSAKTFKTEPLIKELEARRAEFTAQATKASETPLKPAQPFSGPLTKPVTPPPQPIGKDVVPGPNTARVGTINAAIAELKQLGPVASYESIRRIRQAYDGPAKAVYSPAMTQDFLKAQGGKFGAADVTGVLREHLAQWDPATAAANTEYAFWRKATDVMDALEETERVRPKVGRKIMARLTGTVAGGATAGGAGAIAGMFMGPVLEAAVGAGPTVQIQVARQMTRLASALRKGDAMAAEAAAFNLSKLTKRHAPTGAVGVDQATTARERRPATVPATP